MTIFLHDRQIIEISGADRYQFLQGLITNDIFQLREGDSHLIYSAMLSAKGRFLYDFFIFRDDEDRKIYLDCFADVAEDIIKKLTFYKLKSEVNIAKNEKILVFWQENEKKLQKTFDNNSFYAMFSDPRSKKMGLRLYSDQKIDSGDDLSKYHLVRILNKICEGDYDLTRDKSLILEFGFDSLNAINYNKGCYMGQELTARTHYMGEIRKKIYVAEIDFADKILSLSRFESVTNQVNFLKNEVVTFENDSAGTLLSSVIIDNKIIALTLIKESANNAELRFDDFKVKIIQ